MDNGEWRMEGGGRRKNGERRMESGGWRAECVCFNNFIVGTSILSMIMKTFLASIFSLFIFAACNDDSRNDKKHNGTVIGDSTVATIQIPRSDCYISVSGKDTFGLKIEVFPNVVTGVLRYDFHEKDKSAGELDGKLTGDTLFAEYRFMSEGTRSIRQVAFLVKDSIVTEGTGEMIEKDGKMMFKSPANLDFTKGIKYRKVPCLDYDPAAKN